MPTRLWPQDQPVLDTSGAPDTGATIGFFEPGTTTAKDTYADTALTVVNANPVTVDAGGYPSNGSTQIDIWGEGEYKAVVTLTGGATRTWDPVLGFDLSGVATADTYAALTALAKAGLTDLEIRQLLGRTSKGDMEPVMFQWRASSSDIANGGTILQADEGGTGRWHMLFDGPVLARWFGVVADNVTDNTASLQAAIDYAGGQPPILPVELPLGFIRIGNLILPPQTKLYGSAKWGTWLRAKSGLTGSMITDDGNAVKIELINLVIDGDNEPGVTALVRLGHTIPFGTGGKLADLYLRDAPNAIALDLAINIVGVQNIDIIDCKAGVVQIGFGFFFDQLTCVGATDVAFDLSDAFGSSLEIEGPATGAQPVRFTRNCHVNGCIVSLSPGTTFTTLFELDPIALEFDVTGLDILEPDGTGTQYTNIATRTGARPITIGQPTGRNFLNALFLERSLYLLGGKYQAFTLQVQNNAGTLQHRITAPGDTSTAANTDLVDRIAGASNSFTNTPTGAAAFAAGVSTSGNQLYLDTAAQDPTSWIGTAVLEANDAGTAYTVVMAVATTTIGGVLRNRPFLQLRTASSGTKMDWNTTTIPSGATVTIKVTSFVK